MIINSRFLSLVIALAALAGCASNPVENKAEIQRAKSITVVCCDSTSSGAVVSGTAMYSGALLGLGGGMLGAVANRSAMGGSQDGRTSRFIERAGKGALDLPSGFAEAIASELVSKGYAVNLVYPMGYDGFNSQYALAPQQIKGDLILEVRYAGQIVDHADRFFPTFAASFAVRRAADKKMLNRGALATRDPSVKAPPFGDANVVRAPMLVAFGPAAMVQVAEFLDIDESQRVNGGDEALFANAARLYEGTLRANRDLAKLLVSRLDQVKQ